MHSQFDIAMESQPRAADSPAARLGAAAQTISDRVTSTHQLSIESIQQLIAGINVKLADMAVADRDGTSVNPPEFGIDVDNDVSALFQKLLDDLGRFSEDLKRASDASCADEKDGSTLDLDLSLDLMPAVIQYLIRNGHMAEATKLRHAYFSTDTDACAQFNAECASLTDVILVIESLKARDIDSCIQWLSARDGANGESAVFAAHRARFCSLLLENCALEVDDKMSSLSSSAVDDSAGSDDGYAHNALDYALTNLECMATHHRDEMACVMSCLLKSRKIRARYQTSRLMIKPAMSTSNSEVDARKNNDGNGDTDFLFDTVTGDCQNAWTLALSAFRRVAFDFLGLPMEDPLSTCIRAGWESKQMSLRSRSRVHSSPDHERDATTVLMLPPPFQFHSCFVCPVLKVRDIIYIALICMYMCIKVECKLILSMQYSIRIIFMICMISIMCMHHDMCSCIYRLIATRKKSRTTTSPCFCSVATSSPNPRCCT